MQLKGKHVFVFLASESLLCESSIVADCQGQHTGARAVIFTQLDLFMDICFLAQPSALLLCMVSSGLALRFTLDMFDQVCFIGERHWSSSLRSFFTVYSLQSALLWLALLVMKYVQIAVMSRHLFISATAGTKLMSRSITWYVDNGARFFLITASKWTQLQLDIRYQ